MYHASSRIGCGEASCPNSPYKVFRVCNYGVRSVACFCTFHTPNKHTCTCARTHTHTYTRAPPPPPPQHASAFRDINTGTCTCLFAHTRARTHTRTHVRTHARTRPPPPHTHKQTQPSAGIHTNTRTCIFLFARTHVPSTYAGMPERTGRHVISVSAYPYVTSVLIRHTFQSLWLSA